MANNEKPARPHSGVLRRLLIISSRFYKSGALIAVPFGTAVILGVFAKTFAEHQKATSVQIVIVTSALLITVFIGFITFLSDNSISPKIVVHNSGVEFDQVRALRVRMDRLERSGRVPSEAPHDMDQCVRAEVRAQLGELATDQLVELTVARLEAPTDKKTNIQRVFEVFGNTQARLDREAKRLIKSSIFNLALGGTIAFSGLTFLGYSLYNDPHIPVSTLDLAARLAPRVGLTILIEILAFFFLNLYKSSLSELKYYQNELTNVEQRLAAYCLSLEDDSEETLHSLSVLLAQTERNFTLKKGETTIDIERDRISAGVSAAEVLKAIAPSFSKIGK